MSVVGALDAQLQRIAAVMSDFGMSDTDDVPLDDVLRGALTQMAGELEYLREGGRFAWKSKCQTLRAALVGVVGVDGKDELEQMEGVMRLMPAPAQDKTATIDAIHALIATLK